MKKYLFISALVALLVFAFAAVAGAKYAGYALDGSLPAPGAPASSAPGYLSWGGAAKLMSANGVSASLQNSAHGGYVTTTTKCAVCHSVHRATGAATVVGTINNQFLTAGGDSCIQCHTTMGASTASGLPVEWGPTGGPHGSRSCSNCHDGGIHGAGTSAYWGMNAFLLGGASDAQIATELPYQTQRQVAAGQAGAGAALVTIPAVGTVDNAAGWFVAGNTSLSLLGGTPGMNLDGTGGMSATIWAAQSSLLTGFSCGQSGCHTNSVFGNVVWGQTYSRAQLGSSGGMFMTTGHSTAPGANSNHANNQCGPCHPGNPSGGYRLTAYNLASNGSARAYGCTQCHDAVGVATNSVAFPHGNRNIQMYQWANGTSGASTYQAPTTITAAAGNLWMYAGNMASTGGNLTTLVDPSFTLIQGAVGPNAAGDPGNIVDAVCLKCHVPADAQSAAAYGVTSGTLRVSQRHTGQLSSIMLSDGTQPDITKLNPYSGALPSGTTGVSGASNGLRWMFLWR